MSALLAAVRAAARDTPALTSQDLAHALKAQQLRLYYQPQIDLGSARCLGVEALVRWQHPLHGLIFPDSFIPLAEESGLVEPLTAWVLDQAALQCRRWQQQGLYLQVAVNVSARSLANPDLPSRVAAVLQRHAIPAAALEIELTESSVMADPERGAHALQQLTDLGVSIAIDDFGTGFSSLSYLRDIPAGILKVDKSFIFNVASDERARILARSIAEMAHALGKRLVAEGVETAAVAAVVRDLGYQVGQGYYWSKAVPGEDLCAWVKSRRVHVATPWSAPSNARSLRPQSLAVALDATSALIRASGPRQMTDVLRAAIVALGGTTSAETVGDDHLIGLDIALGAALPEVATAAPGSLAREAIVALLPRLILDAHAALRANSTDAVPSNCALPSTGLALGYGETIA